ncbi:TPA: hypothetical protein DCY65_00825 [Candidatus Acetothermia bacterium]|nr:hypothetical protein [Candidatus Acetothermia bacterium]
MKEFSFILGNNPGALAEVSEALGAEHVNLEAVTGVTVLDEGVIAIVTDNPDKTRKILHAKEIEFEEREALVMALPHQPGQLASILGRLADEGINVLSCYCTVEKNQVVLTADRADRAKAIFRIT